MIDARVPILSADIARAMVEVTRMLGAIGVDVEWVERDAIPVRPTSSRKEKSFSVRVLVLGPTRTPDAVSLTLGLNPFETESCSADVVVFGNNISAFARVHGVLPSFVLGLVIVHEIGHALLPVSAHTTVGVMQAPWDQGTMMEANEPGLRFTSKQGALIRARLQSGCLSRSSQ